MTQPKRSRGMPKRTERPAGPSRRPIILIGALVGVVLVAAVGAVILGSTSQQLAQPAAALSVSGQTLPALPSDGSSDPAIGKRMPTLSGTGIDGQALTIGPDGHAMAIVILAHWCPHCQAEVPRIVDWLNANQVPAGVEIRALTTAINPSSTNYPPSAWLERENWPAPTLIDDASDTGLNALGIGSFPGFVFVGPDGIVRGRLTGEISMDQWSQMLSMLGALEATG
jgi:cytochrome c biogenesis protein CcmG/thiol:disulfide interchange protein DsbE